MDDVAKTEARNYISAAGYFILAASFLIPLLANLRSPVFILPDSTLSLIIGIALLITASALILLRKRDLTAIIFFMMGFIQLYYAFSTSGTWNTVLVGFMFLIVIIILTSKEKVKWLLFLIPLLWFIQRVVRSVTEYNPGVLIAFFAVLAALSYYYALVCGIEKINLPGRKLLTADDKTDFKSSGSILGYMLFAVINAAWAFYNFANDNAAFPFEALQTISLITGVLMVFVAALLLAVAKMRFTPAMFFLAGLAVIFASLVNGVMLFGVALLFLAIGVFAIFRKESRKIPGIMFILSSVIYFILSTTGAEDMVFAVGIIDMIIAVIAVYLCFVVYTDWKLPKF